MIEGLFARTMYASLYKMHELALHGFPKVAPDTLARLITRRTESHVKLHSKRCEWCTDGSLRSAHPASSLHWLQNRCRMPACKPVSVRPLISLPVKLADGAADPLNRNPAFLSFFI
jgi:hypothetical protein